VDGWMIIGSFGTVRSTWEFCDICHLPMQPIPSFFMNCYIHDSVSDINSYIHNSLIIMECVQYSLRRPHPGMTGVAAPKRSGLPCGLA
jgi:hypothetical protein